MKLSRQQLRKMINEAFRGYQYASRDGSRYTGSGPSHTFKLREADVRLLEQVILESLQASLKSGHQLGTAVHTASFNIKQSNAIPVLNMEVSEFDDEFIMDKTGMKSFFDYETQQEIPYGQQGDREHADNVRVMLRSAQRSLEEACDNVYYKVLDTAGNLDHNMVDFVNQFMIELKKDILNDISNI